MRRISISSKIMEWICFTLREASSDQKKVVRRWKTIDRDAEFFSTRKQNEHGRFMSILSINKGGRSVVIISEIALNAGWCDIAFKIENFIKVPKRQEIEGPPRLTEINFPYSKAVQESKWHSKPICDAEVTSKKRQN